MRLDKFLKLSRLVKRRSAAQEMIEIGAVRLLRVAGVGGLGLTNPVARKSSLEVSEGSEIEIAYTAKVVKVRVLCADEAALRRGRAAYELLEERSVPPNERPW
ncbi:MAG: RNA-binding S4 domain-containing protein [Synergistaceae bacterium]|jgi:ribosomal 50S subunit-recycling heat shock protein|nr:RNA-binding S4 domain-containing protein [Synergistaceae bacterium]